MELNQSQLFGRCTVTNVKARHERIGSVRNDYETCRADYASSFLTTSSLSTAGFACPLLSFITWPTKKAATVRLPPLNCATC